MEKQIGKLRFRIGSLHADLSGQAERREIEGVGKGSNMGKLLSYLQTSTMTSANNARFIPVVFEGCENVL